MDEANKKILIIEDDKDFLWILRQGFENQGIKIVYAQDGEEGLTMAEKEKPDLMIIDIMLPKIDGITLAKKIKEKGIKSKMIFLTNLNDAEHMSQAIEVAGETDYILKSDLHIEQIVSRVKDKLGIR
ncbi:MAG: response regulator [Candidatus Staskawiczbacteria bacterium]|nr:response regulator [Candidatus Staskawiczbacteria bacterium]